MNAESIPPSAPAAGGGRAAERLLVARDVHKAFGATQALRDFQFELAAGEIHALLGENGAGKSTFIKILAGVHSADAGEITHAGEDLSAEQGRQGIAFIHQDLGLVDSLSVAENFALVTGYMAPFGLANWGRVHERTEASLARLGASFGPDELVGDLAPADRSVVAIARALSLKADILVLDEPTATLPVADAERLFTVLRSLRESGTGIIYVSHRLAEVLRISDRITVMRDGRNDATVLPSDVSERELAALIIGHELVPHDAAGHKAAQAAEVLVEACGMRSAALAPLDLTLRAGEIVGCSGLRGAGHESVGRILFGLEGTTATTTIAGRTLDISSPRKALAAGIGYIVGDRKQGLAPTMSVTENLFLNPRHTSLPRFFRRPAGERARAAELVRAYGVRPPDPTRLIEQLSGGNAQKVALARTMDARPRVLILDEPTAGIDVGARDDFYRLIEDAASDGMSVLLISTDYDEVVRLCDRVLMFQSGTVTAELRDHDISRQNLSATAMGAA